MNNYNSFLGIDLGTSSVKCTLLNEKNKVTAKAKYKNQELSEYENALKKAVKELSRKTDVSRIKAIGLSSQVGTYIVGDTVIVWNSPVGEKELRKIKRDVKEEEFLEEISMKHPDIISYPLPRLMYIKEHYGNEVSVIMPKEYIIKLLTGNIVTDKFSYRGLYNFKSGHYSGKLLEKFNIRIKLPPVKEPDNIAGYITEEASKNFGIPFDIPVFVGCNDFFAGLIGMGITDTGDKFDLSGTSEHIGYISGNLCGKGVSGNYFYGFATYGGTKSSGESSAFAIENFDAKSLKQEYITEYLKRKPPIFLPYLSGERAPVYDENAKGVFFGINAKTDKTLLAYSVLEGVVFSLYNIAENIGFPKTNSHLTVGGGSSADKVMAKLKAELFGVDIFSLDESNTSSLGAAIIAAKGVGYISDYRDAKKKFITGEIIASPGDEFIKARLYERYSIYKSLYPSLKSSFRKFNKIKEY